MAVQVLSCCACFRPEQVEEPKKAREKKGKDYRTGLKVIEPLVASCS